MGQYSSCVINSLAPHISICMYLQIWVCVQWHLLYHLQYILLIDASIHQRKCHMPGSTLRINQLIGQFINNGEAFDLTQHCGAVLALEICVSKQL